VLADRRDRRRVGGRVPEKIFDPPIEEIVDRPQPVGDRRRLEPEPLSLEPALHLDRLSLRI
jgi:hypothetical protein